MIKTIVWNYGITQITSPRSGWQLSKHDTISAPKWRKLKKF